MATIPSFDTYTPGAVVTAANLNKNVRDAGNFFRNPPTCVLRASAAQAFTNNVEAVVAFDTVVGDNDSMADLANNQIVCKTAGVYLVTATIGWVGNATGWRQARVYANGPLLANDVVTPGVATSVWQSTSGIYRFSANAVVQLKGLQTSGVSLNTSPTSFTPTLSATWLCA